VIVFAMRLALPQLPLLLLAVLTGSAAIHAQGIPSNLKQADADYREGAAALASGDLTTAEAKFEEVTRLAPSAEQGHSALGTVLVRKGQWAAGMRELEKALAINPADGSAQLNLAMAYGQTGVAAKAIPLFAKLKMTAEAQGRPLPSQVLAAYARAFLATGQSAKALATMKAAVAEEPGSAELHDELGSLYAQQKEWAQAEKEFSDSIGLKGGFASAHLHLGFVYKAEGKPEAASEWKKACESAPSDPSVALTAGKALADAGDDEDAVPILQQALQLEPRSTGAAYQLALVLQRVNRVQDAIQLLKKVARAEPQNADVLVNLGMALSQAHQAADGVPYLQTAVHLRPKDATAHQDLAAAYLQVNQIDDAIGELNAALKITPDSPQLHYDLGVAYKLKDDAADAIPELEAAERLNPSGFEPAYVLGLLYMQVGRYAEAAQQFEASLKLHPQNGEGWATLGSVYNKLDRLPEAVTALREAIRQMPDQADSHLILATVLVKQNQPSEAAEERKAAAGLMRAHMNLQRAEVATNSGKSLMASGKVDDAIVEFRNALTFDPKYVEAHLELADALQEQGKTAEAEAERSQARSLAKPVQ
jgi:protein O-GlcNAc transferase